MSFNQHAESHNHADPNSLAQHFSGLRVESPKGTERSTSNANDVGMREEIEKTRDDARAIALIAESIHKHLEGMESLVDSAGTSFSSHAQRIQQLHSVRWQLEDARASCQAASTLLKEPRALPTIIRSDCDEGSREQANPSRPFDSFAAASPYSLSQPPVRTSQVNSNPKPWVAQSRHTATTGKPSHFSGIRKRVSTETSAARKRGTAAPLSSANVGAPRKPQAGYSGSSSVGTESGNSQAGSGRI
ncbi:uncharacterized protein JCM15063_006092 [Sporobolomyces koalae]|uniref:uncharacterized protein n=1 Tax=Sporobolomyces koalae TaxID=500713 RepID=UPI003170C6EA